MLNHAQISQNNGYLSKALVVKGWESRGFVLFFFQKERAEILFLSFILQVILRHSCIIEVILQTML